MARHIVFVYGSLKAGFHNAQWLEGAEPLGIARTLDKYTLLRGAAFPFLVKWPAIANIVGELYVVDDAMRAELDRLESHPRFYRRELIRVVTGMGDDGEILIAWAYFLRGVNAPHAPCIGPDERGFAEWTLADVVSDAAHDDEEA